MRKILILLSVMSTMQKCYNNAKTIDSRNVKQIVILIDSTSENPSRSEKNVFDKDSLSSILKQLNSCAVEPISFFPTHRIRIIYNSEIEEMILLNGDAMKYKGHTYRLTKNIRSIIE